MTILADCTTDMSQDHAHVTYHLISWPYKWALWGLDGVFFTNDTPFHLFSLVMGIGIISFVQPHNAMGS